MSSNIDWLRPDRTEPIRKITMAAWKKIFRPYWSPSLPHNGVDTVVASRYAVITQAMCDPPLRSPTIVGSAVDTMVWSSAASSMPSIRAPMIRKIRRWLSPVIALPGASGIGGGGGHSSSFPGAEVRGDLAQ